MRLGALLGPVVDAAAASTLPDQARGLVADGYASLWSAHAVGRGFMLTDPLIALAAAASVTDRVEIGTAVLQLPLYRPAELAHRVLSLAQLCGSRLLLGIGAGSTRADFAAAGADFARRFATFDASLAVLRALLLNGRADDVDLAPWPAVSRPALLFGTWGVNVERAAREFDGWIASAAYRTTEQVVAALARYRAGGGGRAIVSTIRLDRSTDLGALKDQLDRFANAGFDDAVVMFLPGAPAPVKVRALVR